MGDRELVRMTWLPRIPELVFPFFADAWNLEQITPPWLHFRILSEGPLRMGEGVHIDYRLRLRGVGFRWRSLISAWDPPRRFVDEQNRGPYRLWRHEHLFEERDGGTVMTDRVVYRAPGGRWIDRWLVRPELDRIFDFRTRRLETLFGLGPDGRTAECRPAAGRGKEVSGKELSRLCL